jgi:hypothetical protein
VWAALALDGAVRADATWELSNRPDAVSLAQRLDELVKQAKRHPDMLALGLAPHLEAVRFATQGPLVKASVLIPADQTPDLLTRLDQIARGHWHGWLAVPEPSRAAPRPRLDTPGR